MMNTYKSQSWQVMSLLAFYVLSPCSAGEMMAVCTVHKNQQKPFSRTSRSAELKIASNLNSTATIQILAPTAQLTIQTWRQLPAN